MTRLAISTTQYTFLPRDYAVVLLCPDSTYMVWQEGLDWNEALQLCDDVWKAMLWKHPQSGFVVLAEKIADVPRCLDSNRRKGLST